MSPNDHMLEIGTGWGTFALHAARQYGCRVTTATISQEQYEFARQRVHAAGLSDQITVLRQDYRDLKGQYDKLVSIEMIEAVGYAFYDTYFTCCSDLLKPNGIMLLQAIIIADQLYEQAKRSVDFIQRYIFPGSCIPSITTISQSLARATDMRLFHMEDITPTTRRHCVTGSFVLDSLQALLGIFSFINTSPGIWIRSALDGFPLGSLCHNIAYFASVGCQGNMDSQQFLVLSADR